MQHADMLAWLEEGNPLVERAREALRVEDWRACLADPAWASRNANAQVLLTGLNLAAWAKLSPALPAPAAVAGYSVGELASFSAAGVFDAGTALQLAAVRAEAMDRCAVLTPGGLLAVSGLACDAIDRLCTETGLVIAIDNGPGAFVLGGAPAAIDLADAAAQSAGARCTRLKVDVASHTPSMGRASEEFAESLTALSLNAPRLPLFADAADRVWNATQAAQALAQQISRTVQWSRCMENLHARQIDCLLEIGPGAALSKMWNERYPDVPARSVDEFRSAQAIIDWVLRQDRV